MDSSEYSKGGRISTPQCTANFRKILKSRGRTSTPQCGANMCNIII